MRDISRRALLAGAGVAAAGGLAGCSSVAGLVPGGGGGGGGDGTTCEPDPSPTRTSEGGGGLPDTADGRRHAGHGLETYRGASRSGGPPKDGIPAIETPQVIRPCAVGNWLADGDIVFGVAMDGDVRAYPRKILAHHEIVNDVLADRPVSVTYCPLTGTAMGFFRGGTTFGVSGNLVNNNLVMYDRATDSRWPQILGTAMSGEFEGESLPEFRLIWTTWAQWRAAHPETAVLSRSTDSARNYANDPYGTYNPKGGYYEGGSTLFPRLVEDDRLPPKEIVIGARDATGAAAFQKQALAEAGLLTGELAGTPVLAVYDATLDTAYVYRNPEGLSFEMTDGAVRGPEDSHDPDSLPLERVYAFDAMWFAWIGFYPGSTVHGG